MKKNLIIGAVVAAAMIANLPAHANLLTLHLSASTGGSATETDSGEGHPGLVTYNGNIGAWNINITTGSSFPPTIDLNSTDYHQAGAASTLTITLLDQEYFDLTSLVNAIGGTLPAGWKMNYSVYEDATLVTSLNFTAGAFSGSQTLGASGPLTSIEDVITIKAPKNGPPDPNASFDTSDTYTSVPDGGMTLVMLGGALVGLAGFRAKFARA